MGPAGPSPVRWSRSGRRGGGARLRPNPVVLTGGPLRTAADGSFRTPDNLMVGSAYRIAVRSPGKEPILSDWITVGEPPRALLPDATAAAPDDLRPGRRSPGPAGRGRRGLPWGRRPRAGLDPDRRRRTVRPGGVPPRSGVPVRPGPSASGSTGSWSRMRCRRSRSCWHAKRSRRRGRWPRPPRPSPAQGVASPGPETPRAVPRVRPVPRR